MFDTIYENTQNGNFKAYLVPITDWHILKNIKKSYLQLADKHILFCLPAISATDNVEFIKLVKYLDRFRNIHIALAKGAINENLYNLHYLEQEAGKRYFTRCILIKNVNILVGVIMPMNCVKK